MLNLQVPISTDSALQLQRSRNDDNYKASKTVHNFIKYKQ